MLLLERLTSTIIDKLRKVTIQRRFTAAAVHYITTYAVKIITIIVTKWWQSLKLETHRNR